MGWEGEGTECVFTVKTWNEESDSLSLVTAVKQTKAKRPSCPFSHSVPRYIHTYILGSTSLLAASFC